MRGRFRRFTSDLRGRSHAVLASSIRARGARLFGEASWRTTYDGADRGGDGRADADACEDFADAQSGRNHPNFPWPQGRDSPDMRREQGERAGHRQRDRFVAVSADAAAGCAGAVFVSSLGRAAEVGRVGAKSHDDRGTRQRSASPRRRAGRCVGGRDSRSHIRRGRTSGRGGRRRRGSSRCRREGQFSRCRERSPLHRRYSTDGHAATSPFLVTSLINEEIDHGYVHRPHHVYATRRGSD